MKKPKDIRELSRQEIDKQIRDTRTELLTLRLRKQAGQVENSAELKTLRRDIARLETLKREKAAREAVPATA